MEYYKRTEKSSKLSRMDNYKLNKKSSKLSPTKRNKKW